MSLNCFKKKGGEGSKEGNLCIKTDLLLQPCWRVSLHTSGSRRKLAGALKIARWMAQGWHENRHLETLSSPLKRVMQGVRCGNTCKPKIWFCPMFTVYHLQWDCLKAGAGGHALLGEEPSYWTRTYRPAGLFGPSCSPGLEFLSQSHSACCWETISFRMRMLAEMKTYMFLEKKKQRGNVEWLGTRYLRSRK